jgi:hypothetical protein
LVIMLPPEATKMKEDEEKGEEPESLATLYSF